MQQAARPRIRKIDHSFILFLCLLIPLSAAHASTILVVGDSLSAAYGMKTEEGWVSLMEKKLQGQHTVINASVGGHTTTDGLNRLPQLLETYQPDIVIIALGGNDGLRGYSPSLLRNNLLALIEKSRQANARPILAGIQIPPSYGSRYATLFKTTFETLANEENLPFVPFLLEDVAIHPEFMQADGIHPNALAQPKILTNVMPILARELTSSTTQ